VCDEGLVCHMT